MPQIFRPGADSLFRLVLILLVLSPAIGMGIGYALVVAPWVSKEAFAPKQPVPFSHQHHVSGLGIDCRYCHSSVELGPVASIPPTHTCMSCHSQIWTNAELLAPVRRSLELEEPIVWQRVYDLPDFVYFDHSVHVTQGVGCEECHGRIDRQPLTRRVHAFKMIFCLDCHRDPALRLRPLSEITTMGWRRSAETPAPQVLLARYDIDTHLLTDCSVCHR